MTTKQETEQRILYKIADDLFRNMIPVYEDRDEKGLIGFLVCQDHHLAREVIDDTPALYEERGNSLIITVQHP